jgi:excinuclease Cho
MPAAAPCADAPDVPDLPDAPEAAPRPRARNAAPSHGIAASNLEALPAAPGVYEFLGDSPLPLYIGKSVNIRSRVLQHLREPGEARMLAQSRQVVWHRTAGEIGALLLESRLIKTRQPLYNQRLRRSRELCSWQLPPDTAHTSAPAPTLVYSRDVDFAATDHLYGLFASAHAARAFLKDLALAQRLCQVCLGLEARSARGCFGLQLRQCDGVCVGREPVAAHTARLREALAQSQVQRWPFAGAVGLIERDGDWTQTHVVRHWRHEATLDNAAAPHAAPVSTPQGFDLDAYRILVKPLLAGQIDIVPWP